MSEFNVCPSLLAADPEPQLMNAQKLSVLQFFGTSPDTDILVVDVALLRYACRTLQLPAKVGDIMEYA